MSRGGFKVGGNLPSGSSAYGRWNRQSVFEAMSDKTWPGLSIFGVDSLMYLLDLAAPSDGGYANRNLTVNGEVIETEFRSYTGGLTFSASGALGSATADTKLTCVRVDGDLTVDAGATVTPTVRKKGLVIYVRGNATINGTISMTARGAQGQTGQNVLVMNGYTIPATSNAVASFSPNTNSWNTGNKAGYYAGAIRYLQGRLGATGGGGGGGSDNNIGTSTTYGLGAAGNSWSGGAGEGGGGRASGGSVPGVNGGAGGSGSAGDNTNGNLGGGGGAGNPGGAGGASPTAGLTAAATAGASGTGGLIIFVVTGNITGSGSFEANGSAGGDGARSNGSTSNHSGGGGGGSGGGSVNVFYGGSSTFTGTVKAKGGAGGKRSVNFGSTYGYSAHDGAPGSDGTEYIGKITRGQTDTETFYYTGSEQTIVVPAGITQAVVECWGAQGGETHAWSSQNVGAGINKAGGKGGYAKGTVTVTPGETLRVYVGQKGGYASAFFVAQSGMSSSWALGTGGAGWNGGGAGGSVVSGGTGNGAGGGGATDVRQGGATLTNRIMVAAGGGGATGANMSAGVANPLAPGGSGALGTGGSGGNGRQAGGGGGGGYYGGGGGAGADYTGSGDPFDGGDGGAATGADGGGTAGGYPGTPSSGGASGHGKGGTTSGGGGGGSNYVGSATAPVSSRGIREGHGLARITWVRN